MTVAGPGLWITGRTRTDGDHRRIFPSSYAKPLRRLASAILEQAIMTADIWLGSGLLPEKPLKLER